MPIPIVVTKRYKPASQANRDPNRDKFPAGFDQPRTSDTYRRQDEMSSGMSYSFYCPECCPSRPLLTPNISQQLSDLQQETRSMKVVVDTAIFPIPVLCFLFPKISTVTFYKHKIYR